MNDRSNNSSNVIVETNPMFCSMPSIRYHRNRFVQKLDQTLFVFLRWPSILWQPNGLVLCWIARWIVDDMRWDRNKIIWSENNYRFLFRTKTYKNSHFSVRIKTVNSVQKLESKNHFLVDNYWPLHIFQDRCGLQPVHVFCVILIKNSWKSIWIYENCLEKYEFILKMAFSHSGEEFCRPKYLQNIQMVQSHTQHTHQTHSLRNYYAAYLSRW